jgi:FixJ family two-component response regulator
MESRSQFISARRDETIRAQVLKQGAAVFLLKPLSDSALLTAMDIAAPAQIWILRPPEPR